VGKAALVRGESTVELTDKDGKTSTAVVPATIDILDAKEEEHHTFTAAFHRSVS